MLPIQYNPCVCFPGIYRPMKHYNKLLSEKEELVSSESQTSLASLSDTLTHNIGGETGSSDESNTMNLHPGLLMSENGTKSFTIGEGCVIGMHILLGKIGSARGWVWIDAKVDGKPYVGGMPPVTGTHRLPIHHLPCLALSLICFLPYYSLLLTLIASLTSLSPLLL